MIENEKIKENKSEAYIEIINYNTLELNASNIGLINNSILKTSESLVQPRRIQIKTNKYSTKETQAIEKKSSLSE